MRTDYRDIKWKLSYYADKRTDSDLKKVLRDSIDAIEELEKDRDLAIADLNSLQGCGVCINFDDYPMKGLCRECFQGAENNFEWRGYGIR